MCISMYIEKTDWLLSFLILEINSFSIIYLMQLCYSPSNSVGVVGFVCENVIRLTDVGTGVEQLVGVAEMTTGLLFLNSILRLMLFVSPWLTEQPALVIKSCAWQTYFYRFVLNGNFTYFNVQFELKSKYTNSKITVY